MLNAANAANAANATNAANDADAASVLLLTFENHRLSTFLGFCHSVSLR